MIQKQDDNHRLKWFKSRLPHSWFKLFDHNDFFRYLVQIFLHDHIGNQNLA